MKKILALILSLGLVFMVSCGRDNSQKYIDEQEKIMSEAEKKINNTDGADVFKLTNLTGKNIYAIEFCAPDKENLILENIAIPDGNEVLVQNSGEWEIKVKFLADDGTYYAESFGTLSVADGDSVVLKSSENGNSIEKK